MKALGYSRPFNMMGPLKIALLKSRFYVSDNFMCYTCKYTSKSEQKKTTLNSINKTKRRSVCMVCMRVGIGLGWRVNKGKQSNNAFESDVFGNQ